MVHQGLCAVKICINLHKALAFVIFKKIHSDLGMLMYNSFLTWNSCFRLVYRVVLSMARGKVEIQKKITQTEKTFQHDKIPTTENQSMYLT